MGDAVVTAWVAAWTMTRMAALYHAMVRMAADRDLGDGITRTQCRVDSDIDFD